VSPSAAANVMALCEDCPPAGYPTDSTRCAPCPRHVPAPSSVKPFPTARLQFAEQDVLDKGAALQKAQADFRRAERERDEALHEAGYVML
jgi:hypothetical protein